MTAKEVLQALDLMHPARQWAFFVELRVGTGYNFTTKIYGWSDYNPEQRIDAFALDIWPSHHWRRIAYEVKVSRSDFLHEIANPQKRQTAMMLANEFYFAVPAGLVEKDEIPEDCGLVTVKDGRAQVVKRAPSHEIGDMPMPFVASIARRVCSRSRINRLEHMVKFWRAEATAKEQDARRYSKQWWDALREIAELKEQLKQRGAI